MQINPSWFPPILLDVIAPNHQQKHRFAQENPLFPYASVEKNPAKLGENSLKKNALNSSAKSWAKSTFFPSGCGGGRSPKIATVSQFAFAHFPRRTHFHDARRWLDFPQTRRAEKAFDFHFGFVDPNFKITHSCVWFDHARGRKSIDRKWFQVKFSYN